MTPEIQSYLDNLLEVNEEKYQHFRKHRLIVCDVAITASIKNNALNLPSSFDLILSNFADNKACICKIQAAYLIFPYRGSIVKECFQDEVTEFPLSFTYGRKNVSFKKIRFTKKNQANTRSCCRINEK